MICRPRAGIGRQSRGSWAKRPSRQRGEKQYRLAPCDLRRAAELPLQRSWVLGLGSCWAGAAAPEREGASTCPTRAPRVSGGRNNIGLRRAPCAVRRSCRSRGLGSWVLGLDVVLPHRARTSANSCNQRAAGVSRRLASRRLQSAEKIDMRFFLALRAAKAGGSPKQERASILARHGELRTVSPRRRTACVVLDMEHRAPHVRAGKRQGRRPLEAPAPLPEQSSILETACQLDPNTKKR